MLAFDPLATLAGEAPSATDALAAFGWLAGGVWTTDGAALPPGLNRIETRYELAPNGRVIRFTTAFVNADESVGNGYAGDLYFDPGARQMRMWYIDGHDEITQGPITGDGDRWSMSFTSDGAVVGRPGPVDFRVNVVRASSDRYDWSLAAKTGGAWKPVFALSYRRLSERR